MPRKLHSPGSAPWWQSDWMAGLILCAIIVTAYLPALKGGFIWDDDAHLTRNPCVIGPLGFKDIWTTQAARICPLVLTSFRIEYLLWGLNPLPYHLVNVLLQSLSAVLFWRVLIRLNASHAWLGAAFWALHPVQVETVAWITEMKNTQSCLFYLLSGWAFCGWLKTQRTQTYVLSLVGAALAVTSKSSTVILPLVLALCGWWNGALTKRTMRWILPFFVLSALSALMSIWTQGLEGANATVEVLSWPQRVAIAGKVVWFYLGKLAWPDPLIFVYPRWEVNSSSLLTYAGTTMACLVLFLCCWQRNRVLRPLFLGFTYFLIALLPVMGLISHYFMRYSFVGDHFQYLASMGPLALAGTGLGMVLERFKKSSCLLPGALSLIPLVLLAGLTWRECPTFANNTILWQSTLAKNPGCPMAYNNLGVALEKTGSPEEAIALYRKAVELKANFPDPYYNLGNFFARRKEWESAKELYLRALEIDPKYAPAHMNLGEILLQNGDLAGALSKYEYAAKLSPNLAEAHYNLGYALVQAGALDQATLEFQKTVQLQPDMALAHYSLGDLWLRKGEIDNAITQFQKTVELQPKDVEALRSLGNALVQKGQSAQAIVHFQKILEITPDSPVVCNTLACLLATCADPKVRDGRKAEELAQHACQLSNGKDPVALSTLAAAYAEQGRFSEAVETVKAAIQLAEDQGNTPLRGILEQALSRYQSQQPLRE